MDQILYSKSTSMADAFTMLLAIQQGPKGPDTGRIYKRAMIHNQNPFLQFIFHEKTGNTPAPTRWVTTEFRQWDGFFYMYAHTHAQMGPYLPHETKHVKHGFNYARFTEESPAAIYGIHQIERAARDALGYLIYGQGLPTKTPNEQRDVLIQIMEFKNYHRTGGKIYLDISDLGQLLGK